jgi:hypothetical protein
MSEYLMMGDRTRWEVLWVVKKPKLRIVCVQYENDMVAAMETYMKAKKAGKPFATLRSCNVGFPPPEKYRPYFKTMVRRERVRTKRGMKTKKVPVDVQVTPMAELNLKGIWWCPYCREMRKFQHWDGYESTIHIEALWVPDPGMYCPMCGINQRDHHIRKWNPQAQTLEFRMNNTRRSRNGRSTRKRSRRRT